VQILLVDPDRAARSLVAHRLEEFFGHADIEQVSSGAEVMQAIHSRRHDLVIVAHPLPVLGDTQLTAVIKARPHAPAIVVITSGSALELDLQCRAAGVDLLLETRHLQPRLLAFLQRRFPKVWADGVTARRAASLR